MQPKSCILTAGLIYVKFMQGKHNKRTKGGEVKRYNMIIPEDLYNEVERLAEEKHTSMIELFRNFIKFGLVVNRLNDEGAELIIRKNGEDKHIVLMW